MANANLSLKASGASGDIYSAYNTSPMNTTGTVYWNGGTLNGADAGAHYHF